jgi:hypothetical protein
MRKNDLKTGMVIETRDGCRGIVLLGTKDGDVIGGCGENWEEGYWKPMSDLREDLKGSVEGDSDIMKIYVPNSNRNYGSLKEMGLNKIWGRVDQVELTMDEIAAKFGVEVNNLKIKK